MKLAPYGKQPVVGDRMTAEDSFESSAACGHAHRFLSGHPGLVGKAVEIALLPDESRG